MQSGDTNDKKINSAPLFFLVYFFNLPKNIPTPHERRLMNTNFSHSHGLILHKDLLTISINF